jgi:hypothetical protein
VTDEYDRTISIPNSLKMARSAWIGGPLNWTIASTGADASAESSAPLNSGATTRVDPYLQAANSSASLIRAGGADWAHAIDGQSGPVSTPHTTTMVANRSQRETSMGPFY